MGAFCPHCRSAWHNWISEIKPSLYRNFAVNEGGFFIAKLRLPRAIRAWHTCLRLSRHTSQKSLSVALLQPANFCIVWREQGIAKRKSSQIFFPKNDWRNREGSKTSLSGENWMAARGSVPRENQSGVGNKWSVSNESDRSQNRISEKSARHLLPASTFFQNCKDGIKQTAYRIVAKTDEQIVWDSGADIICKFLCWHLSKNSIYY